MAKKKSEPTQTKSSILPIIKSKLSAITVTIIAFFILFSLLSFDINDVHNLKGGIDDKGWLPVNQFGVIGVYLSNFLFEAIGGVSYFFSAILLICGLRHFFKKTHAYSIEYFLGIFLMTLGLSMLFGIWPDSLPNPVVVSEIPNLAGGVIGQRFCSPDPDHIGWFYLWANKSGCQLISAGIFLLGFVIIWINDWNAPFIAFVKLCYAKITEDRPAKEPKPAKVKKEKRPKVVKEKEEPESTGGFFSSLRGKSKTVLHDNQPVATSHAPTPVAPSQPELNVFTSPAESQTTAMPDYSAPTIKGQVQKVKPAKAGKYTIPPLTLLSSTGAEATGANPREVEQKKATLQHTLESFRVDAHVSNVTAGPRVTLFEIVTAPGVNLKKITSLNANIAMDLKAHSLRILAPIPGKSSVGIEVPNEKAVPVGLRSLLESPKWHRSGQIPLALGRDISGDPICLDLAKAPHLLIAGATGSGKSVCMNTIIASMLYKFGPDDLQLILVDPKVVEFKNYETLPHLVTPVVNEPKKVTMALHWAVKEMERRYKILAQSGVKNLESFNARPKAAHIQLDEDGNPIPDKMPFLVIIIDELADIMMTAKGDVETCLARIAQLGRASGIHAIVATQRPSVNVITGIIKANFPTRIAFKVTSAVDSRTILDSKGADQLLGQGDMLFNPPGASQLQRIQGAYVPENELESVVEYVSAQQEPQFNDSIFINTEDGPESMGDFDMTPSPGFTDSDLSDADEELLKQAVEIILKDGRATTSYVQRSLRIGYNRAATIIDELEKRGIIGPQIGSGPREILINSDHTRD